MALWPDARVAAGLHAYALAQVQRHGGRAMQPETLHLTLAFLGEVPSERLPDIEAVATDVAAAMAHQTFTCRLDRCGIWPEKHLLWVGCRELEAKLANLAAELGSKLRQAGFVLEKRPFKPHVTLVRNFRAEASVLPELPALEWPCSNFVLVQSASSAQGANYSKLASWSLAQ